MKKTSIINLLIISIGISNINIKAHPSLDNTYTYSTQENQILGTYAHHFISNLINHINLNHINLNYYQRIIIYNYLSQGHSNTDPLNIIRFTEEHIENIANIISEENQNNIQNMINTFISNWTNQYLLI